MITLIRPDGSSSTITPRGRYLKLHEFYEHIECGTVQMIYLRDGRSMWMDEEAKLKRVKPERNEIATQLLQEAGGMPGDFVLGNVLLLDPEDEEVSD